MRTFLRIFLPLALGGLLYQGGRVLLGLPPTWDTFLEVTAMYLVLCLIVHAFIRTRHEIAHLFGWNYGHVESWRMDDGRPFIGFRCGTCNRVRGHPMRCK